MTSTIRQHQPLADLSSREQVALPGPDASAISSSRLSSAVASCCTLVAFLLPLKLSLTYIVLVPLILGWLYLRRADLYSLREARPAATIISPLLFFLVVAIASSTLGLSVTHSLSALVSLVFFALTIPLFATSAPATRVCHALVAGQSIAALHSFLEAALPCEIPHLFLGKVTESGQVAVTILITLGLLVMHYTNRCAGSPCISSKETTSLAILGFLTTTLLVFISFREDLSLSPALTYSAYAALGLCFAQAFRSYRNKSSEVSKLVILLTLELSILVCALIVNLKRGPWFGVLIGASVFLFLYARRAVLALLAVVFLVASTITPVQQRIRDSYNHFTISGGRSTIWRIGAELTTEYPLGIGYHNSGILRQFAPEVPVELKHFHSNLLNITAETGWLGGAIFIWLLVAILRPCFRDRSAPLYVAIGCAIISWQTAGLVEYNFGDSEITIIVWALVGLVLQRELTAHRPQETA